MSKLNTKLMREKNRLLIRDYLLSVDIATKKDISDHTGLAVSSCTNLLSLMIGGGEVFEIEHANPQGGRPARRFTYNTKHELFLNVYLRKESIEEIMHFNLSDLKNNTIYETTEFHKITLTQLDYYIEDILIKHPRTKYLSIGVPGIVTRNEYIYSCDIVSLESLHMGDFFSDKYDVKTVIENDVNSIALGYYSTKLNTSPEALVYIYYPENGDPGAGIIINGKAITGISNIAGEVKYLNKDKTAGFAYDVINVLTSINYIINPEYIILSGNDFTDKNISVIENEISSLEFKPNILFEQDIHDHYLLGLKYINKKQLQ